LSTSIQGTVGDELEGLDTGIFEWESQLAADKGLQPSKWTFHTRQNKLRKEIGLLTLTVNQREV
jgi:hypothetical protein